MGVFTAIIYHSMVETQKCTSEKKALLFAAGHVFVLESSKGDQGTHRRADLPHS